MSNVLIKKNRVNLNLLFLCSFLGCAFSCVFLTSCGTPRVDKKEVSKRERARLLTEVANGALLEGDPVGALQNLALAEAQDPSLPELYHTRALAFYVKHDLRNALLNAQKSVVLKPDYIEANNTLGKILVDLGRYREAVGPLQMAAYSPINREAYKAFTNLGILKDKQGETLQAESYYDRAIQESPALACQAYYLRGTIKVRDSRVREAISDYDRSTKNLCAYFTEGRLALGMAYEKNKQFQLARKAFLEIQKLYPHTQFADRALERLKSLP